MNEIKMYLRVDLCRLFFDVKIKFRFHLRT
nr:MAG TPA: hypothetical protein [Caudoviricetes sp.]